MKRFRFGVVIVLVALCLPALLNAQGIALFSQQRLLTLQMGSCHSQHESDIATLG